MPMARPYRDAVELAVEPVDNDRSPFTPPNAVLLRGQYTTGVPDAAPVVLLPEYEYHVSYVPVPGQEDVEDPDMCWVIERRKAAKRSKR